MCHISLGRGRQARSAKIQEVSFAENILAQLETLNKKIDGLRMQKPSSPRE